jgi:hypothetical protein
MLGVRDTRRVAWRRQHASRHYVGYVTVTDGNVRLAGREEATGMDVALTIPTRAIRQVRVGEATGEEIAGERSVVLELRDDDAIYMRPVSAGPVDLDGFARKLRPA